MQSDGSSSSVKRSVSDGTSHEGVVRSPRVDQMSTLSLTDPNQDIDSYMAEQGEADISLSLPLAPRAAGGFASIPPEEKVSIVENGKNKAMEVGETWYLVSRDWWKQWRKACAGEVDKEGPVTEQELGPIDNSPLLDAYQNLKTSLVEGVEVEYVPEDIWTHLTGW